MSCKWCDYKGYREDVILMSGKERPLIRPCTECKDTKAYTERVMKARGFDPPEPDDRGAA